jgi:hypothetical protein
MSRTNARCKGRDGRDDEPGPNKYRRWRGTVIAMRAGTCPPSRGAKRPSRAVNRVPQEKRGRRECRMLVAPAASRAKIKKHTSVVTTGPDGFNRHSLRNGFNVYFVISPVNRAYLSPSLEKNVCKLDAGVEASGPHDFAVRFGVVRLSTLSRPPHPAPNVRDDGETPLLWAPDADDSAGDLGLRSIAANRGRLARRANH